MKNKIEKIYENRQKFVVIGLTGKIGSGCSTVAEILEKGYESYNPVDFNQKELQNRKANIINKFASINFKEDDKKFKIIKPSTILIMLFLFDNKIIIEKIRIFYKLLKMTTYEINNKYTDGKKEEDNIKKYEEDLNKELKEINELFAIIKLLKKDFLSFRSFSKGLKNISILNKEKFEKEIIKIKDFYEKKLIKETKENLIDSLKNIFNLEKEFDFKGYDLELDNFETFKEKERSIIDDKIILKREIFNNFLKQYSKNNSTNFIKLYEEYDNLIKEKRATKELKIDNLQLIGDLVREHIDIYQLPTYCNYLIKAYRQETKKNKSSCYIVIDSLKNPFEIVFFKERYSAYYTFSIHSKDEIIKQRLKDLNYTHIDIENIHRKEQNIDIKDKQKGSLDSEKDFNSQNITECVQRSDIYIDNNNDKKDTLYRQIFKYLSLIVHPGLITPSNDEIIMQLALTAKLNSGCISRQVGAVVLNSHGSVKSIGWNDVPEGQTPCLLRSHNELLNNSTSNIYSRYEKTKFRENDKFKYIFSIEKQEEEKYNQYKSSDEKGLNDSFCFKTIQNKIDGDKNQVYTRSLHAEENAFLQASKFGNSEILGGQLFTTASPCFLCAKKAYQLGIKRIVYIEAYPDISNEQVFDIGTHEIEIIHFRGAIGLAHQKLYEPLFPYKDELKALNEVKNK